MVRLYTNRPGFFNDIAEEIRLFFPDPEVIPLEEIGPLAPGEGEASVILELGETWQAHAKAAYMQEGSLRQAEYTYAHPPVVGNELVQKRYEKRCVKIAMFRALCRLFPEAKLPWGSLTGIRPTRLLRELVEGEGPEEAKRIMQEEFDVSLDKLRLCAEINAAQAPVLREQTPRDLDVYIGIPFCATRCLYCSFLSQVRGPKTDMAAYLAALQADIRMGAALMREAGYTLRAMYVGGGTPTVLTRDELAQVLECALDAYGGYGRELTVEAGRPDTITHQSPNHE